MPRNVHLMKKPYTFKKKDKDYLYLEAMIIAADVMEIWEICVFNQECRLSHRTEYLSEGNAFLFNSSESKNCFRPITCPEYIVENHLDLRTVNIKKSHIIDEKEGILLLINSQD